MQLIVKDKLELLYETFANDLSVMANDVICDWTATMLPCNRCGVEMSNSINSSGDECNEINFKKL